MIQGTNVNEICESLSTNEVIRITGNGWRPRSHKLEIFTPKVYIVIESMSSIEDLNNLLSIFIENESKIEDEAD